MPLGTLNLLETSADGGGPVDAGLAHAVALAVGSGTIGQTMRLNRTGDVVAFGRRDTLAPGYARAVSAARALGFRAIERLAGGRAAVFHTGTLAFAWATPSAEPREGVEARFAEISGMVAAAVRNLGADARVGAVDGEYCQGAFSVNVAGRMKIMGVRQRLVKGAVVHDSDRLREVLVPVYRALEIAWKPETGGALEDVLPGITVDSVRNALVAEVSLVAEIITEPLPSEVAETGRRLASDHCAPSVSV